MERRLFEIKRHLVEIKVGVFLLGAVFLLFIGVVAIRGVSFFKRHYIITVSFEFAEGLKSASPVRFCGVDVGEVKRVEVKNKEKDGPIVYVYAKIRRDISIPRNAKFIINSLSLFGEKYLEILPPEGEKAQGYIREGQIVEGISGIPVFNIFYSFDKAMKDLNALIREGEITTSLKEITLNIKEASKGAKELIADLKKGGGTLGKLLYDDSLYEEFYTLLKDIKEGQGTVGRLLYDDTLYQETQELIKDLKRHPWKLLYRPKTRTKKKERGRKLSF